MRKSILPVLFCLSLLGCDKSPFDFRTKYIGDYSFIINTSTWNLSMGLVDTTYSVTGKIDYGSEKNTISVTYIGINKPEVFLIYEDGTIENECKGEFETVNKIKYSCFFASPGGQVSTNVVGKKE